MLLNFSKSIADLPIELDALTNHEYLNESSGSSGPGLTSKASLRSMAAVPRLGVTSAKSVQTRRETQVSTLSRRKSRVFSIRHLNREQSYRDKDKIHLNKVHSSTDLDYCSVGKMNDEYISRELHHTEPRLFSFQDGVDSVEVDVMFFIERKAIRVRKSTFTVGGHTFQGNDQWHVLAYSLKPPNEDTQRDTQRRSSQWQ